MNGGAGDDTFYFYSNDVTEGESITGSFGTDEIVTSGIVDFSGASITDIENIAVVDGGTATFDEVNSASAAWHVKGAASPGTVETFRLDVDTTLGGSLSTTGLTFDSEWIDGEDVIELDGNSGDDTLTGGSEAEMFSGEAGADEISGGGGNDSVDGGSGNDIIDGGAGANLLQGGTGDDQITSSGTDTVDGGDDEDRIIVGEDTAMVTGGQGCDTIESNTTQDISGMTFSGVEHIEFSSGGSNTTMAADQLTGKSLDLVGPGNLILAKPTGAQVTDLSGLGMDTLDFSGHVTINLSDSGAGLLMGENMSTAVTINGGTGSDTLAYTDNGTGSDELDHVANVEWIEFGDANTVVALDGNLTAGTTVTIDGSYITGSHTLNFDGHLASTDHLLVLGSACEDTLRGGQGNDSISGEAGHDHIWGNEGNDSLDGWTGNDVIYGGTGDDTISGGTGADTLYGEDGNDVFVFNGDVETNEVVYGGNDTLDTGIDTAWVKTSTDFNPMGDIEGIEKLQISDGQSATFDFGMDSFLTGLDTISGVSGGSSETLFFQGSSSADTLDISGMNTVFDGWDSSNQFRIESFEGDDTITTSSADEYIDGGEGNDDIFAGEGDDTIIGGSGRDSMDGGSGSNTFIFNTGDVEANEDIYGGGDSGAVVNTILVQSSTDFTDAVISDIDVVRLDSDVTAMFTQSGYDSGWDVYASSESETSETLEVTLEGAGSTFSFGTLHDFVTGEDHTEVTGTGGDDFIYDSAADDSLMGGDGADHLESTGGADTLLGGLGDDTLYVMNNSNIAVIDGGDGGEDTNTLKLYEVADLSSATIENINALHFQSGSTTFAKAQISGKDYVVTDEGSPANLIVAGTTGDDTVDISALDLSGYAKDLTINAGEGDDFLISGSNLSYGSKSATINGGDGDDTLTIVNGMNDWALDNVASVENILIADVTNSFNLGNILADSGATATIDASAMTGSNTLNFNAASADGNDYHIIGGDGYSTLGGVGDTLIGADGDDTIDGGLGDDSLSGSAGDDSLVGGAGADTLKGGTGVDTLEGGDGDDYLTGDNNGSDGNDFMYGGAGADTIKGSSGHDYIEGGDGDDELWGEGITGNDGNDTIHGGDGNDTIYGEGGLTTTGNDLLFGDAGNDVIQGNDGDDTIDGGEGADTMSGGNGTDVLTYANDTTGVSVDLDSGVGLYGQAQGDDLTGGGFEVLIGGSGNDTLAGTSGNESISGGVGDDEIHGQGGADTLDGGLGNDLFHFSGAMGSGGSIDGGDGTDTIYMSLASEDFTGATSVSSIEQLTFAHAGADSEAIFNVADLSAWTVDVEAGAQANKQTLTIQGDTLSPVNETFNLAALAFSANWNASADVVNVNAGDGEDLIIASSVTESINGGNGVDTVDYSNSTAGVSVDLKYGTGSGGWAQNDTLAGIKAVIGSDYGDLLNGADDSSNYLEAGAGDDYFNMRSFLTSGDTLDGGAGDDSLEFTDTGDQHALDNVTGVEHLILGDNTTNLIGHDNLADYLSILTVDASALTGTNNLTWNGNFIANIYQDIIGSDQGDSILGGSNDDTLSGGAGQDSLEGGTGNDYIDGGANNEELRELDVAVYANETGPIVVDLGAAIGSQVSGTAGNDTLIDIEGIWGTAFDDSITGDDNWVNIFIDGGGNDTISGGSTYNPVTDTGLDIAAYYASTESIHAEMHGSEGYVTVGLEGTVDELHEIDMVWGSTLGDSLVGYEGEQQFMPDAGSDYVDGGASNDDSAAYWNLTTGINVSGYNDTGAGNGFHVTGDGGSWTDTLTGIEWIEGTQGNDTFMGNDDDNSFSGWMGADSINGGGGTYNWATYGDDPSRGVDTMNGGLRGIDASLDNGVVLDGWGNSDTLSNIQCIEGSDYNDTISGTVGSNVLEGGGGNDWIDGFGGMDTLDGGTGDDTISVIDGFSAGSVIHGGDGTDELQIYAGLTGVIDITGIEKLVLNTGITMGMEGSAADGQTWEVNATDSGAGTTVNVVAGYAGQGIDVSGWTYGQWNFSNRINLTGYNATGIGDAIVGGLAAELITGLMGDDSLTGGGGEDTFAYTSNAEVITQGMGGDVIADFVSGTDVVYFNSMFGNLVWYEEDNYDGIIDGASSSDHVLVWDSANHRLWYDENATVNDSGTQGVVANFTGATLAMSDVVVDGYTVTAGAAGAGSGLHDIGTTGNDTLTGTEFDDTLEGLAGDDILNGMAGNDTLVGDLGIDSLYGGDGNDELWGDDCMNNVSDLGDLLDGGAGHDMLIGAYGNDTMLGGADNDTLWGGADDDVMSGGDGSDQFLYMSGGAINLSGDTESITDFDIYDYIWLAGDVGSQPYTWYEQSFTGGGLSDSDVLVLDTDTMTGFTTLWYDENGSVINDLYEGAIATSTGIPISFGSVFSEGGTITFGLNKATAGSDGNDTLEAQEGDPFNILFGYDGDDSLVGYMNSDILIGGRGTDTFDGGAGQDTIDFRYDAEGVVVVLNGANTGSVMDGEGNTETVTNVEHVIGSYYDDNLTGDTLDNSLSGMDGDDVLTGNNGNDTLLGGGGDDILFGGAGTDSYDGGDGNDTVSFAFENGGVKVDLSDLGFGGMTPGDHVYNGEGGTLEGLSNVENVIGSNHDDTLAGDTNNNLIMGMSGSDLLFGGMGGMDTLVGGSDSDTFFLFDTSGGDTILDFEHNSDLLALNSSDTVFTEFFDGGGFITTMFAADMTYADACTTIGEGKGLVYVSAFNDFHGQLWYDPDVSDGSNADATLLLDVTEYLEGSETNNDLQATDFDDLGGASP